MGFFNVMIGNECHTKRFYWYKSLKGYVGSQRPLKLRKALKTHRCYDCGRLIPKGSLYAVEELGYMGGEHYCIGCVTPVQEPERIIPNREDLPADALIIGPREHTSEIADCYKTA